MERVFWVGNPAAITQAAAQRAVDRTAAAIPLTASPERVPTLAGLPVPRAVRPGHPEDLEWLGRHLARTKLGLALGGGGAKAYAHIGVMQVLEDAGVAVDYLAGASAGALVGALLAMGLGAARAETSMRRHMTAENCTILMKGMLGGAEPVNLLTRLLREMTQDCTFEDLKTPLVVLTVNADTRRPYPITSGPVWEAVLASWSLPGAFPPYIRDGQRLVDGVVMAPVPTSYVMQAGADVTVGIDVLSGALPAWPGEDPPDPNAPRRTMNINRSVGGHNGAGVCGRQRPACGPGRRGDDAAIRPQQISGFPTGGPFRGGGPGRGARKIGGVGTIRAAARSGVAVQACERKEQSR